MGKYVARPCTEDEIKKLVKLIAVGYVDNDGIPRKPNKQVATILTLQANLGCRIGDICNLTMENFIFDGEAWKLDLTEQKTGKKRYFIVPTPVKNYIDKWTKEQRIKSGRLFTIGEYAVWKQLRPATAVLGLDDVSSHSLRKAAALRTYYASGKDIALTSQFLNHSSPAVSMCYLRRSTKQMDEVLSKTSVLV